MTIRPEEVDAFLALFDESSAQIRGFDGCRHLELWQDDDLPNVFTTFSLWIDAQALTAYRESDLFRTTWRRAKVLFAEPPEAFSQSRVRQIILRESA